MLIHPEKKVYACNSQKKNGNLPSKSTTHFFFYTFIILSALLLLLTTATAAFNHLPIFDLIQSIKKIEMLFNQVAAAVSHVDSMDTHLSGSPYNINEGLFTFCNTLEGILM